MTPEVEAALVPLNWEQVKSVYPSRATWISLTLRPNGGLLHPDAQAAKVAQERHNKLLRAMKDVLQQFHAFSPEQIDRIDLGSCPPEDRDLGWAGRVEAARGALVGVFPGILQEAEFLRWEAGKARRGGRKNEAAYRIAEAVSEIFVLSFKTRPGLGKPAPLRRESNTHRLTGVFGIVAEDVFSALGLEVKAPYKPCKAAIDSLTEQRMADLLKAEHFSRGLSMFDLHPSAPE